MNLRLGKNDVIVGVNLLREGLDIPEVSLVGITDADKEGFLRSERSLIQTIGRAARNAEGRVILYADRITASMQKAMDETSRRRKIQAEYNTQHGITPITIRKKIREGIGDMFDGSLSVYKLQGTADKTANQLKKFADKPNKIQDEIVKLKAKMKKLSAALEFEDAAAVRDEIKRLEILELQIREGPVSE